MRSKVKPPTTESLWKGDSVRAQREYGTALVTSPPYKDEQGRKIVDVTWKKGEEVGRLVWTPMDLKFNSKKGSWVVLEREPAQKTEIREHLANIKEKVFKKEPEIFRKQNNINHG